MTMLRLLIMACSCALVGCSVSPWVAASDRDNLVHPTMQLDNNRLGLRYRDHVRRVNQSAKGARKTRGANCGCR